MPLTWIRYTLTCACETDIKVYFFILVVLSCRALQTTLPLPSEQSWTLVTLEVYEQSEVIFTSVIISSIFKTPLEVKNTILRFLEHLSAHCNKVQSTKSTMQYKRCITMAGSADRDQYYFDRVYMQLQDIDNTVKCIKDNSAQFSRWVHQNMFLNVQLGAIVDWSSVQWNTVRPLTRLSRVLAEESGVELRGNKTCPFFIATGKSKHASRAHVRKSFIFFDNLRAARFKLEIIMWKWDCDEELKDIGRSKGGEWLYRERQGEELGRRRGGGRWQEAGGWEIGEKV